MERRPHGHYTKSRGSTRLLLITGLSKQPAVWERVYSKVLRRSLVPFFEKYARADQHGGVKGRGTEIASFTARVLMRRFSKIGKSFAVLFVDARSAFYSLLLEQV